MPGLRRLLRLLAIGFGRRSPHGPLILLAALLGGVAPVIIGLLTRIIVNSLTVHHPALGTPLLAAAGIGVATLCLALTPAISDFAVGSVSRRTRLFMQGQLFTAVNRLPGLTLFEEPASLDRLRIAQDVGETAPSQALQAAVTLGQGSITLVGFLVGLYLVAPVLGLVVVASAVPDILSQLTLARMRLRTQWRSAAHVRRRIFYAMLHLEEPAAREIRLFGFGSHLVARMQGELQDLNSLEAAVSRTQFRLLALSASAGAVAAGGGLLLAVVWTVQGRLMVGDIALYLAAVVGVQAGLGGMVQSLGLLFEAQGGYQHYESILQTPPDLTLSAQPQCVPELQHHIEFRDVWFRYGASAPWILEGVNLILPAKKTLAIVGVNGAGKTTLAKLLCRFYDPSVGSILWDGIDIRDFAVEALRTRLSASFQDYMCYDLTFKENIALGRIDDIGSPTAVQQAANAAAADVVAARLRNGYETQLSRIFMLGEEANDGTRLSGGEWQRVALARALMKKQAEVLILDEPGAGLDAQTEHSLDERLKRLSWHPTTLLIAHRLSSVRDCDQIAVLEDGRITEFGTHDDLISRAGTYCKLFRMQAGRFKDAPLARGTKLATYTKERSPVR